MLFLIIPELLRAGPPGPTLARPRTAVCSPATGLGLRSVARLQDWVPYWVGRLQAWDQGLWAGSGTIPVAAS